MSALQSQIKAGTAQVVQAGPRGGVGQLARGGQLVRGAGGQTSLIVSQQPGVGRGVSQSIMAVGRPGVVAGQQVHFFLNAVRNSKYPTA